MHEALCGEKNQALESTLMHGEMWTQSQPFRFSWHHVQTRQPEQF